MVTTRTGSYDSDSQTEAQGPSTRAPTLFERREAWAHLLRTQHYQPMITQILEQELPKYGGSTGILPVSVSSIMRECVLILASTSSVFAAAVDGTLARRLQVDTELQREFAIIEERAHVQPSIYIHLLADEEGIAPTVNQYALIRDAILHYLSSAPQHLESAWLIDNVTPPATQRSATLKGYRKYLWTSHRSPQHIEALHSFCNGISKRVAEVPLSERNAPLAYPPTECGYSIHSHIRIAQHRHRQSSNYIMNLVEDICTHLHRIGTFPQLFRMHPFIIYLIFRPQQAAIAEIFCSGLLQVWSDGGGGFNAYPAGRSVASARRVSEVQWAEHQRWVEGNTEVVRNLRMQRERLEDDVLILEREVEEAWREALDSEGEADGEDPKDLDYVPDELAEEFSQMRLD